MDLKFSITNKIRTYTDIESFSIEQDKTGEWVVEADGEEVYRGEFAPSPVNVTDFASKDLTENRTVSPPPLDGEPLNSDLQTLPRDLYRIAPNNLAYYILEESADEKGNFGNKGYHEALLKNCRVYLSAAQVQKLGIKQNNSTTKKEPQTTSEPRFTSQEIIDDMLRSPPQLDGKPLSSTKHTLPRDIYRVAATDVARDLIGGAANTQGRGTSFHAALQKMCQAYLTPTQLKKLGIEEPTSTDNPTHEEWPA